MHRSLFVYALILLTLPTPLSAEAGERTQEKAESTLPIPNKLELETVPLGEPALTEYPALEKSLGVIKHFGLSTASPSEDRKTVARRYSPPPIEDIHPAASRDVRNANSPSDADMPASVSVTREGSFRITLWTGILILAVSTMRIFRNIIRDSHREQ